jgi:transposase
MVEEGRRRVRLRQVEPIWRMKLLWWEFAMGETLVPPAHISP